MKKKLSRRNLLLGSTLVVTRLASAQRAGPPATRGDRSVLRLDGQRQLLIDNFAIDSVRNLKRTLHRPQRHAGNPIMTGTKPWERWLIGANGRAALYDREQKLFKMWYGAYSSDESAPFGQGYRICYATSLDGVHWTRPVLRQVEWAGSKENNLIRGGRRWIRRPNVIQDLRDPDSARRFKMTYVDFIDGRSAILSAYSQDGIRWNFPADEQPWFTNSHSANLLGWDPRIERYVLFRRVADVQQKIGRSTSKNFTAWTEPEVVLSPLPVELDRGFPGLAAFPYEGLYLGLLWVRDVPARQIDSEFALSRDGIEWQRVAPGNSFLPKGETGTWDNEGVTPVAPIVHDDKIWIYYSGWNHPYGGAYLRPVQEGWVVDGMRRQCAIGLATLRLDGFVSVDAGAQTGILTTKAIEAAGSLEVNADVRGEMRVALLDEEEKPLPGFSAEDCVPIRTDSVRHQVRWKAASSIGSLPARPVKMRFELTDASLYSFSQVMR